MLAGGGASVVLRFGARIVRIPRHPFVAERFRVAAALCDLVRDRLPVPVPRPLQGGPPVMECHARLPGRMPEPADAGPELAADVAAVLAALHAVPVEAAGAAGVVADVWSGVLDLAERTLPPAALDRDMRRAFALARDREDALPPVLVHHDLHRANLLVAGRPARLAGIIDFADATIADPHWDFRHLAGLGADFLGAVVAAYGRATGRRLSIARIGRLADSRAGIDRAKALLLRCHDGIDGCDPPAPSPS
ncbi:phosphotransferase family protein [Stella sp.]|uniref:phosphotransferase family protein n=1 Tax=Stella sp. TaxID=2912054 RepID=UPI0035B05117